MTASTPFVNNGIIMKQFKSKAERIAEAERQLKETLVRVGYKKSNRTPQKLKIEVTKPIEGSIPANGTKKTSVKYTGSEIVGISQMHKSNAVPISDLKQAKEHAKMRRG